MIALRSIGSNSAPSSNPPAAETANWVTARVTGRFVWAAWRAIMMSCSAQSPAQRMVSQSPVVRLETLPPESSQMPTKAASAQGHTTDMRPFAKEGDAEQRHQHDIEAGQEAGICDTGGEHAELLRDHAGEQDSADQTETIANRGCRAVRAPGGFHAARRAA